MKFNFKKITSVLASVAMIGSTLGIAAAANYPKPFIDGSTSDVGIVVGSSAASSDFIEAGKVETALQVDLSENTASGTTSSSGASASGGDAINLASTSTKLYMNSNLSQARSVITKQHMPNLLADGTASDTSGTEYKYTQKLIPGTDYSSTQRRIVTFSKSGESIDPVVMLDVGYNKDYPVFNYTLTMTKELNTSDSTVQGEAKLTLMGNEYTVGANTNLGATSKVMYLYGAGEEIQIDGGATEVFTIDGEEHTITLVTTSSSTAATIEVDGQRRDVTKGSSYKFAGDMEVYIKSVVHPTVQGDPRDVKVLVGAQTLHLTQAQNVRYGADDTAILGTNVYFKAANGDKLSSMTISQSAASSTGDYLEDGDVFTDRVFGAVKLEFAGLVPTLDDETRDVITVDGDNSANVYVEFQSALADEPTRIAFAHDVDGTGDATLALPELADASNNTYHVNETNLALINEYIVVNSNDEGRILQVKAIPTGQSATDYIQLDDILTGETFKIYTGFDNYTTSAITIGGGEYYAAANIDDSDSAKSKVCMSWGAGSGAATGGCKPGTQTTLFPRIKLKNGGWLAFMTASVISNATTLSMPGYYTKSTYETGASRGATGFNESASSYKNDTSFAFGEVNYTLDVNPVLNNTATVWGIDTDNDEIAECIFNSSIGPAILLEEEKTDEASNGHAICIHLGRIGTSTIVPGPATDTPYFTDSTGSLLTLTSDSYKAQQVDTWGTWAERDTSSGTAYTVVLKYPDEQMYADILFAEPGATITPGEVTGGSVKVLGSVVVEDSEVSQVDGNNLIVVGGSCINTVAAELLGVDAVTCSADFTAATDVGSGQYLIEVFDSPYTTGKVAMLVAGYEAADTVNAVTYLTNENPATDVDTKLVGTTATSAELVTE